MELFSQRESLKWMRSMEHRLSSVAVILETPDEQVLVVKANYKPYWSFPGGVIDKDETPKQAAIREIKEEVGLSINPDTLEFFAVVDRISDDAHTYQFIFTSPLDTSMIDSIVLQASEIDESALVTRADVENETRVYGKVISHWANRTSGYIEQEFNRQQNG